MNYLEPSFFIIGERKCGTSSLYRYLVGHPQVLPCRFKEPQFFSKPLWYRIVFAHRYRALFPGKDQETSSLTWYDLDEDGSISSRQVDISRDTSLPVITGEASANTFAQVPPARLYRKFPKARLILCLRHPVDRAYAHYNMLVRFKEEGRRIPFQVQSFRSDFIEDIRRYRETGSGFFAGISFYYNTLREWMQVFDRSQFCFVCTEEMSRKDSLRRIMSGMCTFLDIIEYDFHGILDQRENVSSNPPIDAELRSELFDFYAQDVANLESLTGMKFSWA